ncbi:MAG: NFACT RNA binding domain-containing protein [Chlorobi bacterium]|nr:NFACT RNA binding domain-containing protein [Chlorobiota bacterium]
MIRHWLTIAALVEELRPALSRTTAVECYRTDDGEIGIHIETPQGALQLVHAMLPPVGSMYVSRTNPPRKRQRLFPMIGCEPIDTIAIADAERIVTLTLRQWNLVLIVIPGARANVFVCERTTNRIVAVARQGPSLEVGKRWQPPPPHLPEPQECSADIALGNVLQHSRILLAQPYAERLCAQLGVRCDCLWGSLDDAHRAHIIAEAFAYRTKLICTPTPHLARRDGIELLLLDMPHGDNWTWEPMPSVEEGIRQRVRAIYRQWSFDRRRQSLSRRIRSEMLRLERTLGALESAIVQQPEADHYELWGQLLIAHPERHRRGLPSVIAIGWDGKEYTVPLDTTRSVLENAERYFADARKIRRGAEMARTRKQQCERRYNALRAAMERLAVVESLNAVAGIEQELFPVPVQKEPVSSSSQERSRFRCFTLPLGYTLLVGKDARSNDELTFRVARPHDVWLHARGVQGAHGVILLDLRQLPPPQVIEYAAAIVAYYSAARNASYVPVSWTQRKYVRKLKKSAAGAVDLLREYVVFVEPRAPFDVSEAED